MSDRFRGREKSRCYALARPLSSFSIDPWRGKQLPVEILDRVPPHDRDTERAVVGGIMVAWHDKNYPGARVIAEVASWDFHCWQYGSLFRTLQDEWHKKKLFGGREAVTVAKRARVHIADVGEAIFDGDRDGLLVNASRLRAFRIVRQRIFAAVELLRMAWEVGAWDDARERQWREQAQELLDNLKPLEWWK